MRWSKAPLELVSFLDETARGVEGSQKRIMFGFPSYFINGNMYMAAHKEQMVLRLGPSDLENLLASGGGFSRFEPMVGRVMKEYIIVPESVYADEAQLDLLLEKSTQYVRGLPAKQATRAERRGDAKK